MKVLIVLALAGLAAANTVFYTGANSNAFPSTYNFPNTNQFTAIYRTGVANQAAYTPQVYTGFPAHQFYAPQTFATNPATSAVFTAPSTSHVSVVPATTGYAHQPAIIRAKRDADDFDDDDDDFTTQTIVHHYANPIAPTVYTHTPKVIAYNNVPQTVPVTTYAAKQTVPFVYNAATIPQATTFTNTPITTYTGAPVSFTNAFPTAYSSPFVTSHNAVPAAVQTYSSPFVTSNNVVPAAVQTYSSPFVTSNNAVPAAVQTYSAPQVGTVEVAGNVPTVTNFKQTPTIAVHAKNVPIGQSTFFKTFFKK